jgi:peptidoglycan hydrolase-like protein with peptidoglycan-binding domain
MQTTIKSIFSTLAILIALCTSSFAQEKITVATANETTQNQTTKTRAEYLPANIEKAQQVLKTKGLYKGDITGTIDIATKSAIKAYQQEAGLNPTGHLNKDTRQKLGIESSKTNETPNKPKKAKEPNKPSEAK